MVSAKVGKVTCHLYIKGMHIQVSTYVHVIEIVHAFTVRYVDRTADQ